jgi:hypothetical protein
MTSINVCSPTGDKVALKEGLLLLVGDRGKPRMFTATCWLIVPPALDVQTLATRCPRAYRSVPHSSGESWNLWEFCPGCLLHRTSRYLLHAANLATWDTWLYFPSEGRRAEDFRP